MASFSCTFMEYEKRYCYRINAECVPGRPGCILPDDTKFNVDWKQRLEKRRQEKQQAPNQKFYG